RWRAQSAHGPRGEVVVCGVRGREVGRALEIAPAETSRDSVRDDAYTPCRRLDAHLDEALVEGRDVEIEGRRQPLHRERPGIELVGPPPQGQLLWRHVGRDLGSHL